MKPKISEKNEFWIPKERYYELVHFCRQYDDFERQLKELSLLPTVDIFSPEGKSMDHADPTWQNAIRLAEIRARIFAIDASFAVVGRTLDSFTLPVMADLREGILDGVSYDAMVARYVDPIRISRKEYYRLYRMFFWVLDKKRG